MAYVAVRGGERAIERAELLFRQLNGPIDGDFVRSIADHLPYLVDRLMGEGSLYAPELAALALAQSGGDLYEATLLLRAYRSTQPRIAYALPVDAGHTRTLRRISAAFKDIPGGQILGPTLDYSHRLLRTELLDSEAGNQEPGVSSQEPGDGERESAGIGQTPEADDSTAVMPISIPPVSDWLRQHGLLAPKIDAGDDDPATLPDVTREPIVFPAPRAHRLQSLARADTGGVLTLGYAGMRGYGTTHPTVGEVRLGEADVQLRHPISGAVFSVGRVRIAQAEVLSSEADRLEIGGAATFGWNEVKVIAAAMLDLEMDRAAPHPAHQEEFAITHTEPVEASGFCIHYKLPHYVTFGSALDVIRRRQPHAAQASTDSHR